MYSKYLRHNSQMIVSTAISARFGLQLGQVVVDLEGQLGLMEHQCHSLNQDKEQLEAEVHSKQAALHQAASDAQHAQTLASQADQATHER